ncbi:MAG: hypothetical protein HQ559_11000 [Lentisphaerae bacterium]|nr:hypothetical protein [Lentisphaerota bacterium]
MSDQDPTVIAAEAERFLAEKEKIRTVIGRIGGARNARREKNVTIIFIAAVILLFVLDVMRHLLGIRVPLPPLFSLEVGILLVSIKIIWMVHNQTRVEHFQFWILNAIEFRVNELASDLRKIEKKIGQAKESADGE